MTLSLRGTKQSLFVTGDCFPKVAMTSSKESK